MSGKSILVPLPDIIQSKWQYYNRTSWVTETQIYNSERPWNLDTTHKCVQLGMRGSTIPICKQGKWHAIIPTHWVFIHEFLSSRNRLGHTRERRCWYVLRAQNICLVPARGNVAVQIDHVNLMCIAHAWFSHGSCRLYEPYVLSWSTNNIVVGKWW